MSKTKKEYAAEWIDIEEIFPWLENPRINLDAIKEVKKSIQRFGFASPLIVRQQDNQIIAGHTRYQAAIELGLERVPVRFMKLDPADAKLLALADNKTGERAKWDYEKLNEILEDLKNEGFDLDDTAFRDYELSVIMNADWERPEIEDIEMEGRKESYSVKFTESQWSKILRACEKIQGKDEAEKITIICGEWFEN